MKPTQTTLAVLLASLGLSSATAPNPGSEWTKTLLLDDFTGGAGAPPSSKNWIMRTGTSYPGGSAQWGTGEVETYTTSTSNVQQSGTGDLMITALKSSSGQWTSARIESVSDAFQAPAGGKMRIEASLKLPAIPAGKGLGYWPAFWALGANFRGNYTNWPSVGEYDIMEHVNSIGTVTQGLHCGVDPGGPCNEPDGVGAATACPGKPCLGNFHTFTLIVDRSVTPETLGFYQDQKLKYSLTETQLGAATWTETVHHGFYLVMNIAMGGGYPNAVADVTTPTTATMSGYKLACDYVAVWTT